MKKSSSYFRQERRVLCAQQCTCQKVDKDFLKQFLEAAKTCTPWIQNIHAAAEDGVVRWLVPANNRLSHFRRDENLKKERIKNKTSHMLQAKKTLSYVLLHRIY